MTDPTASLTRDPIRIHNEAMQAEVARLTRELVAARKEIKTLRRKLIREMDFASFVSEKHGGAE